MVHLARKFVSASTYQSRGQRRRLNLVMTSIRTLLSSWQMKWWKSSILTQCYMCQPFARRSRSKFIELFKILRYLPMLVAKRELKNLLRPLPPAKYQGTPLARPRESTHLRQKLTPNRCYPLRRIKLSAPSAKSPPEPSTQTVARSRNFRVSAVQMALRLSLLGNSRMGRTQLLPAIAPGRRSLPRSLRRIIRRLLALWARTRMVHNRSPWRLFRFLRPSLRHTRRVGRATLQLIESEACYAWN
mmetsp:Transcript_6582/g.13290  ORF Transcript_6582/g.13290 Transcript_6582/m.13290 type:complete len:244 (+) Transcript_6582:1451-2182(+)